MGRYDVLVVVDYYLPGRLAGGPVTTISNMTAALGKDIRFLIVTRNSDIDGTIYPNVEVNKAASVNGVDVIYVESKEFNSRTLGELISLYSIPILYLNSFFSVISVKTIFAHKLGKIRAKLILAPRGEFSQGALSIKALKKRIYLEFFKLNHLNNQIEIFQASSAMEAEDIKRLFDNSPIHIAPDIASPLPGGENNDKSTVKELDSYVFVSRISPMKNLTYAISVFSKVKIPLRLDIYGSLEDKDYWDLCERLINECPSHISIRYCGVLEHSDVMSTFARYKAFLFPTLG